MDGGLHDLVTEILLISEKFLRLNVSKLAPCRSSLGEQHIDPLSTCALLLARDEFQTPAKC
jgi:hypothetical protein